MGSNEKWGKKKAFVKQHQEFLCATVYNVVKLIVFQFCKLSDASYLVINIKRENAAFRNQRYL